jgi:beta-fructofuranosidase
MADRHPHHRPKFHISPPRGYLNDPNGPIELGGVFHLYYQSRSLVHRGVAVEWGHATTTDLVHWTVHRPAMSPVPGGLDTDGSYSGNTVLEGSRVRAYYSGYVKERGLEHTLTALSDETGASFGSPTLVLDDPDPSEGVWMLRDPFVWQDDDGWNLVTGSGVEGDLAAIRHYRSDDAQSWRYQGHLAELRRTVFEGVDTGTAWECPQIVHSEGREAALVCAWALHEGPVGGVVGFALDAEPEPRPVDDGHEFYAPSVQRESSFGQLLFGWIMEGRDGEWAAEEGWSGAISLPRRAWLARSASGVERVATEPHPAVDALRMGESRPANGAALPYQAEIIVPEVAGRVRLTFGEHEWFDLELDPVAGTVTIDRDRSSNDTRAHVGRAVARDAFDGASGRPAVRMLLDGSVLEVFTSAGRSLTTRVYPLSAQDWTIEAPEGAQLWELAQTVHPETPQHA